MVSKILFQKWSPGSSPGGATMKDMRKEELLELVLKAAELVVESKTQHEANGRLMVYRKCEDQIG